jgi:hypothetical protein
MTSTPQHSTNGHSVCNSDRSLYLAFVRSLERHGEHGQAFEKIAAELGWGEEQTMSYAKRYLLTLIEYENEQDESQLEQNQGDDHGSADEDWTTEEAILFDTLLALYIPSVQGDARDMPEAVDGRDWAQEIAARLPGRSVKEVKLRYNKQHAIIDVGHPSSTHNQSR